MLCTFVAVWTGSRHVCGLAKLTYLQPVLQESLQEEVKDMAKKMGSSGMQLLVIDTENKFVSTGFAEEIAKAGMGKYYYLPNASDASIAAAASGAMADAKAGR